ncbi:MAG: Bug family tripartite tricarboxylate transporter substrate binding protein [Burkholderiales bacterium]
MKTIIKAISAMATALLCAPLAAQNYPVKPTSVVIPYPPGGVDLVARLIQPAIEQELGHPWVIEYKPGASGLIGMEFVSRARPDGYTLLFTASNPWVVTPAMRAKTPYDPIKDFTPITNTTEGVNLIVAGTQFPPNTFREMIDYAKKNPNKVSWATSGLGSFWHLDAENMNRLASTDILHVPFAGFGPMLPAMYSGQVSMNLITLSTVRALIDSGKVKALAIMNSNDKARHLFPKGIQIVSDVLPGFVMGASWNGVGAPAGTPRPIVLRINQAVHKALAQKDFVDRLTRDGSFVSANTPEEFAARIVTDLEHSRSIVRSAKIPPLE